MKSNTTKATICVVLGNLIWGFSYLLTKVGLSAAPDPSVMLAHRFLLSTLTMGIMICSGKIKVSFKNKNWKPVLLLMLLQVSYYLLETYGVLYTNSTISGLVLAVVPVVTIGTGALFLREYPTRRQALFCIMPVVGVIIMTLSGKELGVVTPLGILFLLLTLLASALFKTVNRKAAQEFSPFERTFLVLSVSALFFALLGMQKVSWDVKTFVAPLLQWKYLLSVLCLSLLCSIGANLLVNYATARMSVFKVASFGALSTLCSTVAGIVFLQEPVSLPLLLGAALILVGIRQVSKPAAK